MTTIRCPVCSEFLDGDGESELTRALLEHMTNVHDMQESALTGTEGREHRPELWEGMKRGTVPYDREPGEDIEESVLCPYCVSRIYGHDGEDLSINLRAHLKEAHDIWPPSAVRELLE